MGMFSKGNVSAAINELNTEFYIANIELGDVSSLHEAIASLTSYIKNAEEINSMIAKSKDLAQTWEGQTRAAYDDFVMIEERYQKDMLAAITGYKEIITLVAQKVGDVRNAKQLKEVEKI